MEDGSKRQKCSPQRRKGRKEKDVDRINRIMTGIFDTGYTEEHGKHGNEYI
jgi:hypothetical protein